MEKYPSWPKGLPWKGSRSLARREGSNPSFSALIFLKTKCFKKIKKKFLTNSFTSDKIAELVMGLKKLISKK